MRSIVWKTTLEGAMLSALLFFLLSGISAGSNPTIMAPVANSKLKLSIARSSQPCTPNCVNVRQILKNSGTTELAVRQSPIANVTRFSSTFEAKGNRVHSPGETTEIKDFMPATQHCKVLKPGESLVKESRVTIPKQFLGGHVIYLEQTYSDFRNETCSEVPLFRGAATSNPLKVVLD